VDLREQGYRLFRSPHPSRRQVGDYGAQADKKRSECCVAQEPRPFYRGNNHGIYPIVGGAVHTPNDYFGIGEITYWRSFKNEFENKYMRPFEEG
jgi:hypothetical protein